MKEKAHVWSLNKRTSGSRAQEKILLVFVLIVSGTIVSRLFWLQILQAARFRNLADENRIRLVARSPMRGRLLARNGEVLATNKLQYNLYIQPRLISKNSWPLLKKNLSNILNVGTNTLQKNLEKRSGNSLYRVALYKGLSNDQVLRFREKERLFKGVEIDVDVLRHYPYGSLASHVLGYTQPITDKEYKFLSSKGYKLQDRIGRIGVEAAYESFLRGDWGGEMLEVDALGNVQRSLGEKQAIPGKDILLTIDLKLQQAAERALVNKNAGAIVALNPKTGSILAMASKPFFNPNFFSKSYTTQKEYDQLFNSSKKPLFNRALNAYDPGSTWKPVTAIAGMETGKFPPEAILKTQGCITYGGHCFPEYNRRGFGRIGYEDALSFSSNTFFYQIGVEVGSMALYDAAKKLGFDSYTGIEIGYEESKGLVGNKIWAEKGRGWAEPGSTPWIPEDIASASIGQSVVLVTPLQLARAYAVFANGGYLITPHLSESDIDWVSVPKRTQVKIKGSTLETVRRGLRKVVLEGTGAPLNLPNLPPIAGKSGTAEDSSGGSDHAWFACFAPYDSPQIVVVAFAQNTPGGGSVHALPMARQVIEAWQNNYSP